MQPGQVLHIKQGNKDHYWHIESVCLGGTNQESVIHIGRSDGTLQPDCLGKSRAMFVPEIMIKKLLESGEAKLYDRFENDTIKLTA